MEFTKQFSSLSALPPSQDYVYPSAPYSQTPSTCVLHSLQYEIPDKIAVLYILTLITLDDNERGDKKILDSHEAEALTLWYR